MNDAYDALWAVLNSTGYFLLRVDHEVRYIPTRDLTRFRRTLGGCERLGSPCSLAVVPRLSEDRTMLGKSTCLWARTKSAIEVRKLMAFTPKPTIILRDGETLRHTALWALTGELDEVWCQRLNKRLAHALGTPKTHSDPMHFALTPPGSLGEGDKVSQVVHMEPHFYGAKEIAGRLADPPLNKWKQRQELQAA